MDFIKQDPILQFNPNTLETLRNQYNFEKPGQMDAAIDVLENWIKKQEHFTKKDFSREYLERSIILVKGSVERAKLQMDKMCTLKTLLPNFFEFNFSEFEEYKDKFAMALLPKLTEDNYRIAMTRFMCPADKLNSKVHFVYFKFAIMLWQYLKSHDYCDGTILVADCRELNFIQVMSTINMGELHQLISIAIQGLQLRVKSLHLVSDSNTVNVALNLLKQVLPKKIAKRVFFHNNVDSLHEVLPKELLTTDLGGTLPCVISLRDDWLELFKKEENVKFFKDISNARTNEALRVSGKFNQDYLGIPGSFRSLNVD